MAGRCAKGGLALIVLLALDFAGAFSPTAPGLVRAVRVVPSAAQVINTDTLHWPRACVCSYSLHACACVHVCVCCVCEFRSALIPPH